MTCSSLTVTTHAPAETLALGRRFASILTAGDVVLLGGRLGAGKTLFVGGVAEGLGISTPVTSPTFVLVRRYEDGFLPLVHADVYRLGTVTEFADLELVDAAADGVLVVEWGEAVADALPRDRIVVHIEIVDERTRRFRFAPSGGWCDRSLEVVA